MATGPKQRIVLNLHIDLGPVRNLYTDRLNKNGLKKIIMFIGFNWGFETTLAFTKELFEFVL